MKKSLIVVILSAFSISGLNAQDYNLGGNKFGDNWSIGLNGGIATPIVHFLKTLVQSSVLTLINS